MSMVISSHRSKHDIDNRRDIILYFRLLTVKLLIGGTEYDTQCQQADRYTNILLGMVF